MNKEQVEKAVKSKGYIWFDGGDYDVNLVAIRNSNTGNKVTNLFDDEITLSYKVDGEWQFKSWPVTTDPGIKAVREYHNVSGVARLVEGQYRSSYKIGLHQGKYEALRQEKSVKVYRDYNKDLIFDENKIQEGIFGINIHHAGINSNIVENWSEGCTVFKKKSDFKDFMEIIKKSRDSYGNSFTYTLIETNDIK
jgi:hypothetical protein